MPNIKPSQPLVDQPSSEDIYLTSNKDVYLKGELIVVSLNINPKYKGKVYTYDTSWNIYKFENNEWRLLPTRYNFNYSCANIQDCSRINSNGISDCKPMLLCELPVWTEISENYFKRPVDYRMAWDQKFEINQKFYRCNDAELTKKVVSNKCAEFGSVSPGLYEIRFSYLDYQPEDPLRFIKETKQVIKQIEIR